jgi:hypothetical protein
MVHLPGVKFHWGFQEVLSWSSFVIILSSLGYVFIGDKLLPQPVYTSRRISVQDLYTNIPKQEDKQQSGGNGNGKIGTSLK